VLYLFCESFFSRLRFSGGTSEWSVYHFDEFSPSFIPGAVYFGEKIHLVFAGA
jgi:hypothetical protein